MSEKISLDSSDISIFFYFVLIPHYTTLYGNETGTFLKE